jgi:hypothetical protein
LAFVVRKPIVVVFATKALNGCLVMISLIVVVHLAPQVAEMH